MASTRIFPYRVIRETKKILKTKHKLTRLAVDESFEEVLFNKYSVGVRKVNSDNGFHCEIDKNFVDILEFDQHFKLFVVILTDEAE